MGAFELVLILLVVMIIFGAGKLPNVMKDLGKGVKAFRDGMNDEHKNAESKPDVAPTVVPPPATPKE
jgi:sec-independent protein translocase protein TatA